MRRIILICLSIAFLSFSGCSTLQTTLEQNKSLESVNDFPKISKAILYSKTLSWAARTYNSANNVIQLKDPDTAQIICRGIGGIPDMIFVRRFSYTMIIDIKDNKMRIQFENIQSEQIGDVGGPDMKYQWDEVSNHLKSLKDSLMKSIGDTNKQDW